ncbi:MAG: glutamate 5-kinase [Candidatus Hydrogenedentota bacterium]|nr:glutamate 5-kinase [Candidatus Sumerlaea chitinivorans]RMH24878.1 MAG: glutamate 5-kinase [Candidatus Hydrogenedentota bacterium]
MSPTLSPSPFGTAKTLVLKVGSAVLTNADGDLDKGMLRTIADWTSERMAAGCNVILVTSGAVAAGRSALGVRDRNLTISQKQALAAVGQSRLMQIYAELFATHGFHVGQMLLTAGDMEDRRRYVNARYTLEELLRRRCIPIINENDTVTVDELKFGDNDGLAARVAVKMQADALVLLSDVDGVFSANPKTTPDARLIEVIEKVTPALIEQLCPTSQTGSLVGSGGMLSKLRAARLATSAGTHVAIANGKRPGILSNLVAGKFVGTYFPPAPTHRSQRTQWILHGRVSGTRQVVVDDGARDALLHRHKSLLPAGILRVVGTFKAGDLVDIVDSAGRLLGRGIVNYSSAEMDLIRGHRSADIAKILGAKPYDEAIHRDNLALFEEVTSAR